MPLIYVAYIGAAGLAGYVGGFLSASTWKKWALIALSIALAIFAFKKVKGAI